MLDYERLDVYQRAIEHLAVAVRILNDMPKGQAALADQLKRAALSIPLNIAEGSGKPEGADRIRYVNIARGSAMECGAIHDATRILGAAKLDDVAEAKLLIERIVSMLTRMSR
jgi:four helix bundle protein